MSFASDLAIGFKSIFGNADIQDIGDENTELTGELRDSFEKTIMRARSLERGWDNSVDFHASDRIFTAPNIPVIGSIVAWVKSRKINKQLKKRVKSSRSS